MTLLTLSAIIGRNPILIMKILFFADLHARKNYRNLSTKGVLNDILLTIEELGKIASRNKVKTIFSLGDLFHKVGTVSVELLARIYSAFRDLERKGFELYFLVGNHDLSGEYTVLEPFEELGHVIKKPTQLVFDQKTFFIYPFTKGTYMWEEADVFLGHLALAEGSLDATDVKLKEEVSVKELKGLYKIGLLGHYHDHQTIGKFWYIGSALQLSFAEADQEKYCVILNTTDLSLDWKLLKKARTYKVIDLEENPKLDLASLNNSIVKFQVPEDWDEVFFGAEFPKGCEYFIERKSSARKIEVRLESDLAEDELVERFLELTKTSLSKEELKALGLGIIAESKKRGLDAGI